MNNALRQDIDRAIRLTRPYMNRRDQSSIQRDQIRTTVCRSPRDWDKAWPSFGRQVRRFNVISLDTESRGTDLVYVIVATLGAHTIILTVEGFRSATQKLRDRLPEELVALFESKTVIKVGRGIMDDVRKDMSSVHFRGVVDVGDLFRANEERWFGPQTYGEVQRTGLGWLSFLQHGQNYKPHQSRSEYVRYHRLEGEDAKDPASFPLGRHRRGDGHTGIGRASSTTGAGRCRNRRSPTWPWTDPCRSW